MSTLPIATPEALVHVRLNLSEPIFAKLEALAVAFGVDVEEYISQHLAMTCDQDHSGAGIWFDGDQARRLCDLTGRGVTRDATTVLNRLTALATIRADKVSIRLDANVYERLKHRPDKHQTPEQFIARSALNGIRADLGLGLVR